VSSKSQPPINGNDKGNDENNGEKEGVDVQAITTQLRNGHLGQYGDATNPAPSSNPSNPFHGLISPTYTPVHSGQSMNHSSGRPGRHPRRSKTPLPGQYSNYRVPIQAGVGTYGNFGSSTGYGYPSLPGYGAQSYGGALKDGRKIARPASAQPFFFGKSQERS
jgi:hypothetical protein